MTVLRSDNLMTLEKHSSIVDVPVNATYNSRELLNGRINQLFWN
jgi:hypothetical protein